MSGSSVLLLLLFLSAISRKLRQRPCTSYHLPTPAASFLLMSWCTIFLWAYAVVLSTRSLSLSLSLSLFVSLSLSLSLYLYMFARSVSSCYHDSNHNFWTLSLSISLSLSRSLSLCLSLSLSLFLSIYNLMAYQIHLVTRWCFFYSQLPREYVLSIVFPDVLLIYSPRWDLKLFII